MKVTLIDQTPNPVQRIADIASICYGKDKSGSPNMLVRFLYDNGHHSVFEHVTFTFKIEGISRACSHQLVRHRMASFTQRSQRYCNESEFEYIAPVSIYKHGFEYMAYRDGMKSAKRNYDRFVEFPIPAEDARYILPNAAATDLYMTCNLSSLIHIANERLCMRAQWEIRELAGKMVALVDKELQFMLVPKCKSGRIICNDKCGKMEDK